MMQRSKLWGILAMTGGLMWMIVWVSIALRPEAEQGGYRRVDDLVVWIMIAMALVILGYIGFHWRLSHAKMLVGNLFFFVTLAGASLMALGRWMQFQGLDPQPTVGIGWILLGLGLLSYGIYLLAKRIAPGYIGVLYLIAAVSLFALNDQDWRAWLAIPFGGGWIGIGWSKSMANK
ncbi:hypothetical protein [Cohnella cholangitidis]|uniref:Uncharacterized protein n=1 Tax=Cohnella cholangitidis TaxID=2598458 RepID=A0A7G5BZN0_9BACL|nr:hypothetical protein [Cohnella cholangitidis]QMV42414.1 hypothetical protein FPL14_15325 [Cohnella cholangitidis]